MSMLSPDLVDATVGVDRQRRPSLFGLEGTARLWMIVDYADAAFAQALLPGYLQLATSAAFLPGKHPMLYSFGTQRVAPRRLRWPVVTYQEAIIGVCSVELKKASTDRRRYSFMTVVPLNNFFAMILGRLLGFPKTLKRSTATDRAYAIETCLRRRRMLTGDFRPRANARPPEEWPNFHLMKSFLADPVISRAPWGSLLESGFDVDARTWMVTPVGAEVAAEDDLPGFPAGSYAWSGIDVMAAGAVLSEHRWSADWPSRVVR